MRNRVTYNSQIPNLIVRSQFPFCFKPVLRKRDRDRSSRWMCLDELWRAHVSTLVPRGPRVVLKHMLISRRETNKVSVPLSALWHLLSEFRPAVWYFSLPGFQQGRKTFTFDMSPSGIGWAHTYFLSENVTKPENGKFYWRERSGLSPNFYGCISAMRCVFNH